MVHPSWRSAYSNSKRVQKHAVSRRRLSRAASRPGVPCDANGQGRRCGALPGSAARARETRVARGKKPGAHTRPPGRVSNDVKRTPAPSTMPPLYRAPLLPFTSLLAARIVCVPLFRGSALHGASRRIYPRETRFSRLSDL